MIYLLGVNVRAKIFQEASVLTVLNGRTQIYRISADCQIYPIYPNSDIYEGTSMAFTLGTKILSNIIRLSDITD